MPFRAAETTRLYEIIAEQIGDAIRAGEYRVGDRLPAERELSRQCAVGRPTIREAILALEIAGVVEVRGGSGVYVRAVPSPLRRVSQSHEAPFEAFAARQVIETEIAAIAAEKRSPADIEALREALARMCGAYVRGPGNDPSDREFHLAIARATGNSAFVQIMHFIWDELLYPGPLWVKLRERRSVRPTRLAEHAAIVAAIESGDTEATRRAMQAHFDGAMRDFLHLNHVEAALGARAEEDPAENERRAATSAE